MSEHDLDTSHPGHEEDALAARLEASRPVLGAAFRGDLGRMLAAIDPGYGPRPERLRLAVASILALAALLMLLGAVVSVGSV